MADLKKMSSSRKHHLKTLMLGIGVQWLEEEVKEITAAKEAHLAETCGKVNTSGDQAALIDICKKLVSAIDKVDDERYDVHAKVLKGDKEIEDLKIKMVEVGGVKKPALKKVRMSASAMLAALLGTKHSVNMDLRSSLKTVKKEKKEEDQIGAGDWRQNVDDKADRKKMFNS